MEVGFPTERKIALLGQKVDATACTVVSATSTSDLAVLFGSLLVYDDSGLICAKCLPLKPIWINLWESR